MEEISIEKTLDKKYYNLKENIIVTVVFKNLSNHILENLVYREELLNLYSIFKNEVTIDGFKIKLRENQEEINIGNLNRGEEKAIILTLAIKRLGKEEKVKLKGKIFYYCYGTLREKENCCETILKGANLEIKDFKRDKEVLFNDETCIYNFKVFNSGNIVSSNVIVKYEGGSNFRTLLDSVKINGMVYREAYIERGINIGSIFEGDFRNIEFQLKMKKDFKEWDKPHKIKISYEYVGNSLKGEETIENLLYEVPPITLIRDEVKIEKYCDVMIVNSENYAIVTTKIKNDTGVSIKDFILLEMFSEDVNINEVLCSKNKKILINGSQIVIDEIKDKEEVFIKYKIRPKKEVRADFLEVYSKGIFNLGSGEIERRFIQESEKISIELNINRLEIKRSVTSLDKDETFKRKISLKNTSNRDINRVTLYDILPKEIKIVYGSFKVNGNKINNIDTLNEGIELGELNIGEIMEISYIGEVCETFNRREIDLELYCNYNIKCDFTEEVSNSSTEKFFDKIKIDKIYKEFFLNKKIDIKKLCLREVQEIKGVGYIKNIVKSRAIKEIKEEGRLRLCTNYIVDGAIEVNLEYVSYAEDMDKLFSLNIPIEFKESVEGDEYKRKNTGEIIVQSIKYEVLEGYLNILMILEIFI